MRDPYDYGAACCVVGNQTFIGRLAERRLYARGSFQLWSSKYKYSLCLIPKCGCTNWLDTVRAQHLPTNMLVTSNDPNPSARYIPDSYPKYGLYFMPRLGETAAKSAKNSVHFLELETKFISTAVMSKDYFKAAIVRNPWDRLISGYRNKYQHECKLSRKCLHDIYHAPIETSTDSILGLDELLEGLLALNVEDVNPHFAPSTFLCEIGAIPYDFIGDITNDTHMAYIGARLQFRMSCCKSTWSHRNYPECTHPSHARRTQWISRCRCTVLMLPDLATRLTWHMKLAQRSATPLIRSCSQKPQRFTGWSAISLNITIWSGAQ